MMRLAEHLGQQFPDVPVHFIDRGCLYQLVTVQDG
jgi:hypothetical protein